MLPRPGVAEPQGWQHMDFLSVRAPVSNAETNQDICWGVLGILYQHVSVLVARKDPGIEQLVFKRERVCFAPTVFLHQIRIRKRPMRILVEGLHVAVGGSIIQIEVILLHVFPVISFAVSEPEKAFLQNRSLPFQSASAKQSKAKQSKAKQSKAKQSLASSSQ